MYGNFRGANSNQYFACNNFYQPQSYNQNFSNNHYQPEPFRNNVNFNSADRIVNEHFDGFRSDFTLEQLQQNETDQVLQPLTGNEMVYQELTTVNTSKRNGSRAELASEPLPGDRAICNEIHSSRKRPCFEDATTKVRK